jgi:uncharacterized protein YggU (UPF0235/DUF167 family)
MIGLEPHPQGTVLPVRAQAGARRNGLRGEQAGQLKVSVTQVAEKGKANEAIVAVLSTSLAIKKSQIELLSGPTAAQKKFLIRGVTPAELATRIARAQRAGESPG